MTQEQILKMDNLKVAEVKPNMFVHIHAKDGYIITAWGEQEDIKEYSGSVCMYMPIRDNYDDDYRTITVAEHQELEARQLEAMRLEEQNRMNEMNN
jgi:hypothetical protein